MTGPTSTAGLAGLAVLARAFTRLYGIEGGARRTARCVASTYSQMKRPWLAQMEARLGPTYRGAATHALLHGYVRQEARRITHQLLSAGTPSNLLAERFVKMDAGTTERLHTLRGAVLLGGHLGFIPYASLSIQGCSIRARLVMEREVRDRFCASLLGQFSPCYRAYVNDPHQVIVTGGAYARAREAIRSGEIVCILGDAGHRYSVETTLLGQAARLATGPYALARSLGVPLVTYALLPEAEIGYRLSLGPELDTCHSDEALVNTYVSWLEATLKDNAPAWSILPWYLPPP